MEVVAGFFVWLMEILGIRWMKKDSRLIKQMARFFIFLVLGFLGLVLYFAFLGTP